LHLELNKGTVSEKKAMKNCRTVGMEIIAIRAWLEAAFKR
jgi:hypothetical protein